MRGNKFGKMFSVTSFGESHGTALGAVIDGMSPGVKFSLDDLQKELDRRAPGKISGTTSRKEPDQVEILSGIFEGETLGTPIAAIIRNNDQRSGDYKEIKSNPRPGHADQTTLDKYGIKDHRGGGRSSGRETIARVIAGYFAGLIISEVKVKAYINQIGDIKLDDSIAVNLNDDFGDYSFPDIARHQEIQEYLLNLKKTGDSAGGKITIIVQNISKGLGEPVFDKLKADLAKACLSIGGCVSFSYGLGEEMASESGSKINNKRDNFGGIEGGISNGDTIKLNLSFKPTSTIGKNAKEGRHDPCIVPRVIPVAEAMVKVVLADHFLRQNAYLNL
jgi:chorismate synthase